MFTPDEETYYQIKLALSENVGPITFHDLIKYFKNAREAILHLPEFAARGGRKRPIKIAPDSLVDKQIRLAQQYDTDILTVQSPHYPQLLKQIEDHPPILYVKGLKYLLNQKSISIVGSRNCSINGRNLTQNIAFNLAQHNYVIVSGMARGIDAAAHEGALSGTDGKSGGTIAVLGTGIDKIYPQENEEIYQKIAAIGCLVSELPIGTSPLPHFFPRRNRIISGLSLGVLVIEAHKLSGSLITAQCALNQNREVFAVPGSPLDSRSEGPNHLIQEGAHLVTSAEDILRVLDFDTLKVFMDSCQASEPEIPLPLDEELSKARRIILEHLSPETTDINQLIRGTHLPTSIVNVILVELELAGRIERFTGGKVALIYDNERREK